MPGFGLQVVNEFIELPDFELSFTEFQLLFFAKVQVVIFVVGDGINGGFIQMMVFDDLRQCIELLKRTAA